MSFQRCDRQEGLHAPQGGETDLRIMGSNDQDGEGYCVKLGEKELNTSLWMFTINFYNL